MERPRYGWLEKQSCRMWTGFQGPSTPQTACQAGGSARRAFSGQRTNVVILKNFNKKQKILNFAL